MTFALSTPACLMSAEITDHGVPRLVVVYRGVIDISCSVFEDPEIDSQPNHNVNPGNQTAMIMHSQLESPTILVILQATIYPLSKGLGRGKIIISQEVL